jgi:hypothetical protein
MNLELPSKRYGILDFLKYTSTLPSEMYINAGKLYKLSAVWPFEKVFDFMGSGQCLKGELFEKCTAT